MTWQIDTTRQAGGMNIDSIHLGEIFIGKIFNLNGTFLRVDHGVVELIPFTYLAITKNTIVENFQHIGRLVNNECC